MKQIERIDVSGSSIRGQSHDSNHDRYAIADLAKSMRVHQTNLHLEEESGVLRNHQGHVYLVADGVSGGPTPALASSSAARSVVDYFLNEMPWYHLADGGADDVVPALEDAVLNAQDEVLRTANGRAHGMASTLTLAFVNWPDLYLAHVGDSRAYLVRDDEPRLLTRDHSVAELRRRVGGTVRPKDEKRLWNAVGGFSRQLDPQVKHLVLEPGDLLVLVTDGVVADRSTERMETLLRSRRSASKLCDELLAGPGVDDRTAVVARFLPREAVAVPAGAAGPAPTLRARRELESHIAATC